VAPGVGGRGAPGMGERLLPGVGRRGGVDRVAVVVSLMLMIASAACAQTAAQDELPDDYIPFTLSLSDSALVGSSEELVGFTITMGVARERFPRGLDLEVLHSAIRDGQITGTLTYPDSHTTAIAYEMVRHRGPEEIYMKSTLGYFLWERVSVTDDTLHMAIYWWYCPPATPADTSALEMAARLLADPDDWRGEDDRDCADDSVSGRWSLFCALKHASLETMGEYNHHNRAMQTVRFVIAELVPNHGFAHTLMDYNNATTTKHADILRVLELARERVRADLASPAPSPGGGAD
jgi:hypothetical protein